VQGIQVVCVITILLSLNVNEFFMDYAILFLLSSVAAMLPLTIGGAGMREAVLLFLPELLKMPIEPTQAVTMSLLFFLINVIISLPGAFIQLEEKKVVK
jgi:glycosyltransferase 2 family protein